MFLFFFPSSRFLIIFCLSFFGNGSGGGGSGDGFVARMFLLDYVDGGNHRGVLGYVIGLNFGVGD